MATVLGSVRAFFTETAFTIDSENAGDVVARERLLDRAKQLARGVDNNDAVFVLHIFRAGFRRRHEDLVEIKFVTGQGDEALLLELPGH